MKLNSFIFSLYELLVPVLNGLMLTHFINDLLRLFIDGWMELELLLFLFL